MIDQEEIITEETRKLVGYLMPLIEILGADNQAKQNIKKIIWQSKDNLVEKLNQAKLITNDRHRL